jgi:hypothetical protein
MPLLLLCLSLVNQLNETTWYKYSSIKKLKWSEGFHGCPMHQVGATEIEEEEEEDKYAF